MATCRAFLLLTAMLLTLAAEFAFASALVPCHPQTLQVTRIDQGCVNQGSDLRIGAPVVCWLQRHLSWKSVHRPRLRYIGRPSRTHLAVAWPPYLVYNSPKRDGTWHMIRLGFRYDRTWQGYIFPTAAVKRLPSPLQY